MAAMPANNAEAGASIVPKELLELATAQEKQALEDYAYSMKKIREKDAEITKKVEELRLLRAHKKVLKAIKDNHLGEARNIKRKLRRRFDGKQGEEAANADVGNVLADGSV